MRVTLRSVRVTHLAAMLMIRNAIIHICIYLSV